MPKSNQLDVFLCSKLVFIFPIRCIKGLATLEVIRIFHAPHLKLVFGKCDKKKLLISQML